MSDSHCFAELHFTIQQGDKQVLKKAIAAILRSSVTAGGPSSIDVQLIPTADSDYSYIMNTRFENIVWGGLVQHLFSA